MMVYLLTLCHMHLQAIVHVNITDINNKNFIENSNNT